MYTKEQIAAQLETNNEWLIKGILAIYARQTAAEQLIGETREDNGIGFNGADANILSSFARQIQTWQNSPINQRRFGIPLSAKQLVIARKKMKKYAKQLANIANENVAARQAQETIRQPEVVAVHSDDYDA